MVGIGDEKQATLQKTAHKLNISPAELRKKQDNAIKNLSIVLRLQKHCILNHYLFH
jgi:hypothetical protein